MAKTLIDEEVWYDISHSYNLATGKSQTFDIILKRWDAASDSFYFERITDVHFNLPEEFGERYVKPTFLKSGTPAGDSTARVVSFKKNAPASALHNARKL